MNRFGAFAVCLVVIALVECDTKGEGRKGAGLLGLGLKGTVADDHSLYH